MIGVQLGPWILEELLGQGGMGTVYRARRAADAPGDPAVAAVKVLTPELAVDPGFVERFNREIDILRRLDHPHIVRFLDSGSDRGRTWFAMEYVPGQSFEEVFEVRGRLPWGEVLELALQIAPALKHAHDHGVIHRDVKPSNLLRGPDGIKLSDFGIASLFASRHLTVTGGVVGTAEYLSPEQAAGKPVTARSDLYSLGVVLYTLVTGRNPFEGEQVELLHKHRFAQFEAPSRLVSDIPGDFEEIICELLEKDPGRRPADAGVLARRLAGLQRRMEYKVSQSAVRFEGLEGLTIGSGGEGPATLMSRLMRAELERQNRGGPVKQFINRPWVLATLFVLCVSTILWAFWPPSAESLYRHGEALMNSDDPDDWATGWDQYLARLEKEYPDYRREEVAEFRKKYDGYRAARKAKRKAEQVEPMTEAEWFYQEGMRQRQRGNEAGARRTWQALADAFRDVPTEQAWVRLAEQLAKGQGEANARRQLQPLRDAVKRARELRGLGKDKEADAILNGLRELYGKDPVAEGIIQGK
jgi:serine/threonine-protein kinase